MEKDSLSKERILTIYPRYGRLGASSRLRHYAFLPALEKAGLSCRVQPFFRDRYLQKFYAGGRRSVLEYFRAAALRSVSLLYRDSPLWIEYEPFPGLPPSVNAALLKGRRYVLSFDDAVWAKHHPESGAEAWAALFRNAAGIIVANPVLREAVAPFQTHLLTLPTPVEQDACPLVAEEEKFPRFTVAWIGTPVTFRYLESHSAELRAMAAAVPDMEFLVIASRDLPVPSGVPMHCVDWEEASAPGLLARSHVGIMPLDEDNFSRGKSACKLIQYAAAGIPSIASPVGENCRVVRSGETGFLARTPGEWAEALRTLAADSGLRRRMGEAARARAAEYDLAAQTPVLTEFLRDCLKI